MRSPTKLLAALLWAGVIVWFYYFKVTSGLSLTDLAITTFSFITGTVWGPLLYILIYTFRPLTFFPGSILTLLSGLFFGFGFGVAYTIIGANLSATLAYFIGRYFRSDTKLTSTFITDWIAALKAHPFTAILTMHLIFLPYDLINYGAGILRLPFVPYLLATLVGTLLGIITFVSLGASLNLQEVITQGFVSHAIDIKYLLLSGIILVVSLGIAKLLKSK